MKRTIVVALILKVGFLGIAVEQLTAQDKGDEPAVIINGDINGDGGRNITDALQLLGWLFGDAPSPVEFKVDGDQAARISELERQLAEAKEAIATLEVELEDAPRGCNFPGAYFYYANLRELDFRDANLEGADLRGAYLDLADLRGANLEGASLFGAVFYEPATDSAPEQQAVLDQSTILSLDQITLLADRQEQYLRKIIANK